jgi:hypothetical protein
MHYVSMWNEFSIYPITTFNILSQLNMLMVYFIIFSIFFGINDAKTSYSILITKFTYSIGMKTWLYIN